MLYRRLIEDRIDDSGVVLSDGTRDYTIRQIHEAVNGCRLLFREHRLRKGDRVTVSDSNPALAAFTLLACIAEGCICVPLSDCLDLASRREILENCAPALVVSSIPPPVPSVGGGRALQAEDTAVYLIYTSGSTGTPKGVLGCQKQIFFCCEAILSRLELTRNDRILCALPLSFDYGMYQIFLALFSGAFLFLDGSRMLQQIPYLLRCQAITVLPTIPTVGNLLLKTAGLCAAPDLRMITFTGELLPLPLIREFYSRLPAVRLVPMYGLTECKRVSIMPPGREDKILAGSCGQPLDGVTVRLEYVDAETGIGELVVEGGNVMEGYWGHSEGEEDPFFVNPDNGKRCVRTQDLFRIDAEGFLFFCGRNSDILKIRGYRVNCGWLENRFRLCPGVLEAAVIGLPDAFSGERAAAVLHINSSASQQRALECRSTLPSYLRNMELLFTESPLPRNRNGKLDREALRSLVEES